MTLIDTLIVVGVWLFILYIIFTAIEKKRPGSLEKMKQFIEEKKQKVTEKPKEVIQQTYDSRSMM